MISTYTAALMILASSTLAGAPLVPNAHMTPGDWNRPATPLATLCKPGYTAKVRNVPEATKLRVLRAYGIDPAERGGIKVDHSVPLELDGRNTFANLWPQRTADAQRKDKLEGTLHRLVCNGKLPLATAQREIANDWPAAYRRYVEKVAK